MTALNINFLTNLKWNHLTPLVNMALFTTEFLIPSKPLAYNKH